MSEQLALPSIDAEEITAIATAENDVIRSYHAILKALCEKAKAGDKTASELLLKYVIVPRKEKIAEQARATRAPMPLVVRLQLAGMSQRLGVQSSVSLTQEEFDSLPAERQKQLADVVHVTPVADATVVATEQHAAQPREPNAHCIDCGSDFWSPQPKTAKRCPGCKKTRSMARLMATKQRKSGEEQQ